MSMFKAFILKGSIMSRRKIREKLMQLIFQMDIQQNYSDEAKVDFFNTYIDDPEQTEYAEAVVEAIRNHKEEIDNIIEGGSNNWKLNRISKVDLSILRLSIAEIMYLDDIPASVSASEAVDLANKFGGERSGRFINGIIGGVIRENV